MLWLLLACAPGADEVASTAPPTPWDPGVPEGAELPVELDQIAAGIEALAPQLVALDASAWFDLYEHQLDQADDDCPALETTDDGPGFRSTYWAGDGCVADSGATFDGYVYATERDAWQDQDGRIWRGDDAKGEPEVLHADGSRFVVGGFAYQLQAYHPDTRDRVARTGLQGDVLWDGPDVTGDAWFLDGVAGDVELTAWWIDEQPAVHMEATVTGLAGAFPTVQAHGFGAVSPLLGADCPSEPGGLLGLRTDQGWITVAFAGASAPPDVPELAQLQVAQVDDPCDGCGTVWWDGQVAGQVCGGVDAWLDWEERPW